MDHTLVPQEIGSPDILADLLSFSTQFEPNRTRSTSNPIHALRLLGSLEHITRKSLEEWNLPQAPAVKQSAPALKPDQKLLEALLSLKANPRSFRRTPGIYATILSPNPKS